MPDRPTTQDRLLRRSATFASIAVASVLVAVKLVVWVLTGSVALLSSLIDSSMDLLASIVTLMGVLTALQPPDSEHRYGHGKAEPLSALSQAAFIAGSALILSYEAVRRLIEPTPIAHSTLGVAVMVLSIVLTFFLVSFQRRVVRQTGSIAIGADQLHYSADLVMNVAVIAALGLTAWTGEPRLDALFALGIAGFMLHGARRLAHEALGILMDKELPDAEREKILAIVNTHPEAMGVHDLRTRHSGRAEVIEMHLELDGALTLHRSHDIADAIEEELRAAYPRCEVLIHQEPYGLEDDRLDDRIG